MSHFSAVGWIPHYLLTVAGVLNRKESIYVKVCCPRCGFTEDDPDLLLVFQEIVASCFSLTETLQNFPLLTKRACKWALVQPV